MLSLFSFCRSQFDVMPDVVVAFVNTPPTQRRNKYAAGWQSGHAAACKAVYAGSIPTPASSHCPDGEIGRHKGLKIPRP
jgi:hypothetical protein